MLRGVACSVTASILFAVLYYYSTLLAPLAGEDIFAWRMLLTVPFMITFTALIGEFHLVRAIWSRLCRQPGLILVLIASAHLIGLQLWLFMWAPLNGRALEVSLGYFMLPLALVLADRLIYRGALSGWQKLATALACVGVAHEVMRVGGFSWPALAVAIGYPGYFVLRRRFGLDNLGGLWFDLVLLLPAAAWFALQGRLDGALLEQFPGFYWLIPLLGLLSASALMSYIVASRLLRFAVFGLLGYVEPVLLVVVALVVGETITAGEWFTYGPIWLAVGCLAAEGGLYLRKTAHSRRAQRINGPGQKSRSAPPCAGDPDVVDPDKASG
ncbi:MAG: EamA family transporter RarD [Pelovirga sp.]